MADRLNIYAERLIRTQDAIALLEDNPTQQVTLDGVIYGIGAIDTLNARLDWLSLKAAIEAIETGAQQYTILGRSFTKADLAELYRREETLLRRMQRTARPGLTVLYPVLP